MGLRPKLIDNFIMLINIILCIVMIPMAYVLFGLMGRCFCNIGTNEVGAAFLFGRRLHYVVGGQEDLNKFLIPPPNPAFAGLVSPNTGKIVIAFDPTPFRLLSKHTNLRMYSWNPLASLKPVEIVPRKTKEPASVPGSTREPKLRDFIDLPSQSVMMKFLRIDSTQVGLDEEVELSDKQTRINYIRETTTRAWDLDVIWVNQGAKFSTFVNTTLKGGHTNYLKTLTYDAFKTTDFSEASTDFDRQIQNRISGVNGILVLSTNITDYELGVGQEALIKAQIDAQAAVFIAETTRTTQQGVADGIKAVGEARANAIHKRMMARFIRGRNMNPNLVVLADALESGLAGLGGRAA